jgi:putative phosphoribosyl transferase
MTSRFSDLASAGRELALQLEPFRGRDDVLILALVRGGFPAAVEVARHLDAPLDLVLRRTVLHVGPMHTAVAINAAGTLVLDDEILAIDDTTPEGMNATDLLALLERRTQICRGDRPPVDIGGKTILLIDNGVRTGDTVSSSIRALRRLAPSRIVLGLGAASRESRDLLHELADEVVCLLWPEEIFGHVGLWYRSLDVPSDEEIGRRFASL